MTVIIRGFPNFAIDLAKSLQRFDKRNRYIYLRNLNYAPDGSKVAILKNIINYLSADIVYFIGGTLEKSIRIDFPIWLRKKVVMHWVGTDVLTAAGKYPQGLGARRYREDVTHFCETPWIQEELRELGINAEIVQFATFPGKIATQPEWPEKFSILSYMGAGREDFYGLQDLIRLAQDFPQIEIRITNSEYYQQPLPSNIKLLGWVEDMARQYAECVLYLRLPWHDGLSFSVLEALANGRYVGYSFPLEHTIHVPDYPRLKEVVQSLLKKFEANLLPINQDGIRFIKENFNENIVLGNLGRKLKSIKDKH
jgi:hypothetical protein